MFSGPHNFRLWQLVQGGFNLGQDKDNLFRGANIESLQEEGWGFQVHPVSSGLFQVSVIRRLCNLIAFELKLTIWFRWLRLEFGNSRTIFRCSLKVWEILNFVDKVAQLRCKEWRRLGTWNQTCKWWFTKLIIHIRKRLHLVLPSAVRKIG